jgi:hypothetical protein
MFQSRERDSQDQPENQTEKPAERKRVGYEHWMELRRNYTQGFKPYNSKFDASIEYKKNQSLKGVEQGHFDTLYDSIVNGRTFQKPVSLSFVMLVILHGWRKGLDRRELTGRRNGSA